MANVIAEIKFTHYNPALFRQNAVNRYSFVFYQVY